MTHEEPAFERVPTGIPGFDSILEGGLLKGGVYIVQGPPGAGKTIFGNQICFAHAARDAKAVYVTLLAESHTQMLGHMRRMTFFDAAYVADRIHYLSAFKILEQEGLVGLLATLRKVVMSRSATLLVLDGLVSAEEASPDARDFKKFIHELQTVSAMVGCTVQLLGSTERPRPFRPEHTMVDGIIELSDELSNVRPLRHIRVQKIRGVAQVRGQHSVTIDDDGIHVHPRFETMVASSDDLARHGNFAPCAFGIPELDRMLHGGVPSRSVTMLLGPSGSGKTMLALQFLSEGIRQGEPVVYFGFYERPAQILRKSARVGLGLETPAAQKLLEIVWQPPVESIMDILGERLINAVRRTKARRLVIDGMQGFDLAVDSPGRIRDVFSKLVEELDRMDVTTLYTMETPDLFGPQVEVSTRGLSSVTENIVLLKHVEVNSHLCRLLSILKLRESDYDGSLRELVIGNGGITLADTFGASEALLTGTAHSLAKASPSTRKQKRQPPAKKATKGRRVR
jgi:circadian clock protein KaiC